VETEVTSMIQDITLLMTSFWSNRVQDDTLFIIFKSNKTTL